jgi:hypothetical protein
MTVTFNAQEQRARSIAARNEHKRELVLKANPELRARELADKYGLDADDMLMHLRERFLAVVEDAEVAIQTDRLTNLDDQSKTELREWLQVRQDARAIAQQWGLDSSRVLLILLKTARIGSFSIGNSVSYNPCLETALTRAQELGLFSPLEVVEYFEDFLHRLAQYPEPDEVLTANNVEIDSVIALLTGQLDRVFAPLLSRLSAVLTEEAEAKPAEQAA